MKTTIAFVLVALSSVAASARAQAPDLAALLSRSAAAIRPTASELKWREIPWLLDLGEAYRQSAEEQRAMFIWVSENAPLERC
jgi:hypothetical protein